LPFQGQQIGPFTVMSPSLDMYEALMPQFRDTPRPDRNLLQYLGHWLEGIGRRVARDARKIVRENWDTETLREGGITSAENESSVVLLGDLGSGGILLTADAGLKALGTAIDYVRARGIDLSTLWLFQVPHHGSRNNISPSMLNRIVGRPVEGATLRRPHCIISAGAEDEEHPRQVVVNALCRRGLNPCVTRNGT
jgi:beta-lactamase superfamily II metal-dependent hydrolase